MSHQEGDISWQLLRRIVQEWKGTAAELSEVSHLDGGSISTTLLLTTRENDRAVLKISPYRVDRSYNEEAHQLDLLRSLGIPTPRVYLSKTGTLDDPNSYLVLEFMPGMDMGHARQQCSLEQFDDLQRQLAEIIITIHHQTASKYFRLKDGSELAQFDSWPVFYHEVFDPVWAEAQKLSILSPKLRKQIGKVHDRLDRLLLHNDVPRLCHWDIWTSNILCSPDDSGKWRINCVLDPMCKYAHAEAEIAYIDLFHTSTPAFNKSYQQHFKLDDTYHRVRKPIYQLYPLLNHVCMFGAEYMKPLMAVLERLGAVV
jgi:fructosamine-3-kinase